MLRGTASAVSVRVLGLNQAVNFFIKEPEDLTSHPMIPG